MSDKKHSVNEDYNFIINSLKEGMKEQKITIIELSKKLQVSASTLNRYFNKKTQIPLITFLNICEILDNRNLYYSGQ